MSQVEFDEGIAAALEIVYGTRDYRRRRELVLGALGAAPGERVLDVGCGPGFYLPDLADAVGADGAVAGVDPARAMLALAERRCAERPNVELREGGATSLPLEDATFDAALSVQVLEYVEDVAAAVAELRRVLRPGGRVVLWDVDWQTVSMRTRDEERHRRVLTAWDRHLVHRSLPAELPRLLRAGGFEDVALEGHAFATSELVPDAYGGTLVAIVESYLRGLDDFPDEEAAAWGDEQRELAERGEFYFACVQCRVTARAA
jgi:arsenite methyltransferase